MAQKGWGVAWGWRGLTEGPRVAARGLERPLEGQRVIARGWSGSWRAAGGLLGAGGWRRGWDPEGEGGGAEGQVTRRRGAFLVMACGR